MTLAVSNNFKELAETATLICDDGLFKELAEITTLIYSDDDLFKEIYGFTLTEYMNNRVRLAEVALEVAESIHKHVRNTGIAQITGGSVGVASGTCSIIGLALAPFTFGASLGLTIAGTSGGIASAGTVAGSRLTLGAIIAHEKMKFTELLEILDSQEREGRA